MQVMCWWCLEREREREREREEKKYIHIYTLKSFIILIFSLPAEVRRSSGGSKKNVNFVRCNESKHEKTRG